VKGGAADGIATNDARLIYKTELRGLINENVVYPAVAKRMNVEGVATVSFRVLADGSITNVSLESSSGNKTLDAAALEAVKKIKRYKAIPSEFATNEMDLSIPIKFKTI
jgi:protein TonB